MSAQPLNGRPVKSAKCIDKPVDQIREGQLRIATYRGEWTTRNRLELIDITEFVRDIVRGSNIETGFVHLQSLHTTMGLLVSEWQEALLEDVRTFFDAVVDREAPWRHNDPSCSDCDRKNADSHLRGLLTGPILSVQVSDGDLLLGTFQRVLLAEFDGPRVRTCSIRVAGL